MNERNTIAYWAERTVKAKAWDAAESLRNKRGGNPFEYSERAMAHHYFLTHSEDFIAQRDAYIAAHPMSYAPTTKKLRYLEAVA